MGSKWKKWTVNELLHIVETDLDSTQLHKVVRENYKLARQIRRALGIIRHLQHRWPQQNYSLYRWIINHETPTARLQRFNWRRYKRMKKQTTLESYYPRQ